nr:reverse transcriptase domain-containing protein [Tanacetum cinerariifolium]
VCALGVHIFHLPTSTIPRRSKKQTTNVVEPEFRTIVTMADNHTMAQMLQAPIEGYKDAIVVPQINTNNFELKQTLINIVQSNQFTGRQDPHNHLRFFNKVTSTFRHSEVPNTIIKLLLFPFSLEGEARIWLDKEPPRSILTWEDLVSKFINQFFPPSKTTYLWNEITNFLQKPNETFNEAWERFKNLLRQCPRHGFSELHQLDTFSNALNLNDHDALDSAVGGNFLDKIPRECLSIIESKSKVRYSRSRVTDVRGNANAPLPSSSPSNSFDLQQIAASLEDKLDIRMNRFEKSLNDMKNSSITPTAPLKAVEEFKLSFVSSSRLTRDQSSKQKVENCNLEEHLPPIVTMADNRTMAELLRAPTEGYAKAIVVPLILAEQFELNHSLINMMTTDQFFGLEKDNLHEHIRWWQFTGKKYSSQSANECCDYRHDGAMTAMLKQFQATSPPAPVKAVEEICVTCGAAAVNYNQGNPGYRPQGVANQIQPPGFAQSNVQNNQNLFGPPQGFNRGNNFNHEPSYQATAQQNQNFHLNELEKIKRINKANMKALQTQIDIVKNELRNEMKSSIQTSLSNQTNKIKNMMVSLLQMNIASTSSSGTLPSNTVANPKGDLKSITTRSGVSYDGPSTPPPVVENEPEATKDTPVNTPVSTSKPNPKASIPYPSRRNNERNRKKANDQIEKFYQIFKDMSFEISFTDALILMPKFASTLKALIGNKEKLSEMARTPLNEHCSAVLLKKLPMKLGDPGKFLIPCNFSGMAKCLALADLGASISLMPYYVWKKLSLLELTPTCMTLELADRSISRPVGVAEDVYVKVGSFHFPTDFLVVDFDADPRVPLILGRSFLKTERALIYVFEGELTLRVDKEAITLIWTKLRVDDPPTVELKVLPPHLEYAFLEGDDKLLVIIAKALSVEEKTALITVFKSHKRAIAWKLSDIKGINPEFCTHKILLEDDFTPAVQHQRRENPKIHDVIKQEVIKLLDVRLVYPITDSPWVVPVHCVPKKGGFTVVENEENELIPLRLVTGWRVCIDYQKMLKRCEDTNLCLNWEKSHFMVKEGVVLGHNIFEKGIEVDIAKIDLISKLPHPTTVKGIRSFLGHAGFYRRFIKDFSKIARPITRLLEKDSPFIFSQECVDAFQTLKRMLTETPILIALDWDMPFELMCDASDFAIGAVLGQRRDKHFRPIHYARKTMTEA